MDWNIGTAARTLWQEARGEPAEGQRAVAHVIVNRMRDGRWGRTLASVCLWRAQFSGWYLPRDPNFSLACGLSDDDPLLMKMSEMVRTALEGEPDPTGGATHYANLSLAHPFWVKEATHCGKIGHHDFYKDVK